MNFFDGQDRARRSTTRLVVLFLMALAVILTFTAVACYPLALYVSKSIWKYRPPETWKLLLYPGLAALLVVTMGSLFKLWQLRKGGEIIAELLGGERIAPNSDDVLERRLLNVLEEMAIAAGMPVPALYVLPHSHSINALAAGLTSDDAVVAVTRGALERLDRDELQGVVGHELSHLLNGDARLNVRMTGVLHGIMVIANIGEVMVRARGRKNGFVVVTGLFLWLIGAIGVLFGRLIKSAVNRQRELLADASAVQFTRNPLGLAGALKKIASSHEAGVIQHARAEETSHFFFANALQHRGGSLFSTHPPLYLRIRQLDPQWNGKLPLPTLADTASSQLLTDEENRLEGVSAAASVAAATATPTATATATATAQTTTHRPARVTPDHVTHARLLLQSLPAGLRDAVREPLLAREVVLAMLLDASPQVRARQLAALQADGTPELAAQVLRAAGWTDAAGVAARLPLLDLALPALRMLSGEQVQALRRSVNVLVRADPHISRFEFGIYCALSRHLGSFRLEGLTGRSAPQPLRPLAEEGSVILSAVAHLSASNPEQAFRSGAAQLRKLRSRLMTPAECDLTAVHQALMRMSEAAPTLRNELLTAASAVVVADAEVSPEEAELLRAIADALECPVPPLLPKPGHPSRLQVGA